MQSADKIDDALKAAHDHVNHAINKADGYYGTYPWWHGWALRVAFLAGAQWQKDRQRASD